MLSTIVSKQKEISFVALSESALLITLLSSLLLIVGQQILVRFLRRPNRMQSPLVPRSEVAILTIFQRGISDRNKNKSFSLVYQQSKTREKQDCMLCLLKNICVFFSG